MGAAAAVRVRAPAKINLSLRVVGCRPDGFHELQTIFQSVRLYDTLTIRAAPGPFAFACSDPACPQDRTNIVWRAAEQMWRASGRRGLPRNLSIHLTKRIPMQAGLGGGSSDAAAALRALASVLHVDGLATREVARALGADVPYFLEGGTVLGLERGDLLFPLRDIAPAWVVLALPDFGVSTKEAFAWWDASMPGRGRRRLGARARASRDCGAYVNDLQPAVAKRHPEIGRLIRRLDAAGASYAAMSGSGSAVFGLFHDRRAAERGAGGAGARGCRTFVVRTVNRAAYQRLAGVAAHRINLPFAPRRPVHS